MAEPAHKNDAPGEKQEAPPQQQQAASVTQLPRTHQRHRNLTRGLIRFVLMVVLPLTLVIYGASLWAQGLRYISTENAYVKANLVAVSADISGRVIEINVADNQEVRRGEVLFRIDPRDYQLAVQAKLAELDSVKTEIEAMRAEYRAGQRETEELREQVSFLEREYKRARELADRGVGTAQKLDEAQHQLSLARRTLTTKEQSNRTVLAELGGDADIPVEQHPKYQTVVAQYDRAELDQSRTTVLAPADGYVSNVNLRLGEYVRTGTPVFSMVENHEMWVEANLKETQLTHITVGQHATLVADAFPDVTYQAKVDSISPATGAEFALLPPQNASGNWVKVVQRVPTRLVVQTEPDQPRLRAGMTVSVSIDTERRRTLGKVVHDWLDGSGADAYVPDMVMNWLADG